MKQQLVVIGNGMAGVACVEQILKRDHNFDITIFGDETHVNYNRIMLSLVLAGEKSAEEIVINEGSAYTGRSEMSPPSSPPLPPSSPPPPPPLLASQNPMSPGIPELTCDETEVTQEVEMALDAAAVVAAAEAAAIENADFL